jgi:ABC-type dipeptide/oligopeptide/nickel transport system permease component
MGKRLLIGLLKGLVLGIALGAGVQVGLGWAVTVGLIGFLLAMAVGSIAGVLAGKPPWRTEAWIETVLKGVAGIGVGALIFWLASLVTFALPFEIFGAPEGSAWNTLPLLYMPLIAAVFGSLVELDNTPDESADSAGSSSRAKKVRAPADDLDEILADVGIKKQKKRKGA